MTALLTLIGLVATGAIIYAYLVTATPTQIVNLLRLIMPTIILISGIIMTLIGRVVIGVPLMIFAVVLYNRARKQAKLAAKAPAKAVLRTAMLEVMIDQDQTPINGIVLAGKQEGSILEEMDAKALKRLVEEIKSDEEGAQLLKAYLDRRKVRWTGDR